MHTNCYDQHPFLENTMWIEHENTSDGDGRFNPQHDSNPVNLWHSSSASWCALYWFKWKSCSFFPALQGCPSNVRGRVMIMTSVSLVEPGILRIHLFSVKASLGGHFVTSNEVTWSLAPNQSLCGVTLPSLSTGTQSSVCCPKCHTLQNHQKYGFTLLKHLI